MSISRRLFLRNTAAVSVAGAAVAAPAAASEPSKSPHEQAIWHIRKLERLALDDGALDCIIFVSGHYREYVEGRDNDLRSVASHNGRLRDDGMFAAKGSGA